VWCSAFQTLHRVFSTCPFPNQSISILGSMIKKRESRQVAQHSSFHSPFQNSLGTLSFLTSSLLAWLLAVSVLWSICLLCSRTSSDSLSLEGGPLGLWILGCGAPDFCADDFCWSCCCCCGCCLPFFDCSEALPELELSTPPLVGPAPLPWPSLGGGGPGCSRSAEGLAPCSCGFSPLGSPLPEP
jgi:hypothetical protein